MKTIDIVTDREALVYVFKRKEAISFLIKTTRCFQINTTLIDIMSLINVLNFM